MEINETGSDRAAGAPASSRRRGSAKLVTEAADTADMVESDGAEQSGPVESATTVPSDEGGSDEARHGKKKDNKKRKKKDKKDKNSKSAVIIRFDAGLLPRIDARAGALDLSRAAWVRMVVAQALAAT